MLSGLRPNRSVRMPVTGPTKTRGIALTEMSSATRNTSPVSAYAKRGRARCCAPVPNPQRKNEKNIGALATVRTRRLEGWFKQRTPIARGVRQGMSAGLSIARFRTSPLAAGIPVAWTRNPSPLARGAPATTSAPSPNVRQPPTMVDRCPLPACGLQPSGMAETLRAKRERGRPKRRSSSGANETVLENTCQRRKGRQAPSGLLTTGRSGECRGAWGSTRARGPGGVGALPCAREPTA